MRCQRTVTMQRLVKVLFLFLTVFWTFAQNTDSSISNSQRLSLRAPGGEAEFLAHSCLTPKRLQGRCISIFECEELFFLYSRASTITENEKKSLKDASCGWGNGAPNVCCANENSLENSSESPLSSPSSSSSSSPPNWPTNNRTSLELCGKAPLYNTVRTVGGRDSILGAWPWMTALYLRDSNTDFIEFGCGGSLIASKWVLTAAHCIPISRNKTLDHVRLGDLDIDSNVMDGANPVEVKIKRIIKHPNYKYTGINEPVWNDIALLLLEKPVEYTQYIRPICLQSGKKYLYNETFHIEWKPTVIGWGNPETTHLQEVDSDMMPQAECKKKYKWLDNTTLCTLTPNKDSCKGDSGGSLMFVETGGIWSQGGIVSYGPKVCATEGLPGVYTKVAAFIDWINKSTGLKFSLTSNVSSSTRPP